MTTTDIIKDPIVEEFAKFEELYKASFKTDNPLFEQVFEHVLSTKGKQIRPILTLLSAKLCGPVNHDTYFSSIALELMHSASLIHDDVVDEALQRRGKPSVNSAFNNKVAVLSGDFLFSEVFQLTTRFDDKRLVEAFASVARSLAEGEVMQLENYDKPHFNEKRYFDIITKKTAILFSTCMYAGAVSSKLATTEQMNNLKLFGDYLGLCFQIKDDIFDFSDSTKIGKPTANDIREKKMTLPLIYAYNHASLEEKAKVDTYLQMSNLNDEAIDYLVDLAKRKGGIEYSEYKMEQLRTKAIKLLNDFSNQAIVNSLITTMDYVLKRNK